jgi:hypothetical protein
VVVGQLGGGRRRDSPVAGEKNEPVVHDQN